MDYQYLGVLVCLKAGASSELFDFAPPPRHLCH